MRDDIGQGERPRNLKIFWLIVLAGVCMTSGAVAGYKLALVHEHDRLERNKALVRRMHVEVWSEANKEKAAKARQLYNPNFVLHDWTGDDTSGLDGLIKQVTADTFSHWTEHLEMIVAEGDLVADRIISTGTQARDFIPFHTTHLASQIGEDSCEFRRWKYSGL
jgi:hypothetical protein